MLVRLLVEVDPDPHNEAVVDVYGHSSYSYSLSINGFVQRLLVDASSLLRPVVFVDDPYLMRCRYGLLMCVINASVDLKTEREMHFFKIKGFTIHARSQAIGRKR